MPPRKPEKKTRQAKPKLTPIEALQKRYASLVKRWTRSLDEENARHKKEVEHITGKLQAAQMVLAAIQKDA